VETTPSKVASHYLTDAFSDRSSTGPPTQVDLEDASKSTVTEPFIKSEFPEKSQLPLGDSSVLLKQDFVYLGPGLKSEDGKLNLVQKPLKTPANASSSYPIKIVRGTSETGTKKRARVDSDGRKRDEKLGETGKRSHLIASKALESSSEKIVLPSRISKTKKISSKTWKREALRGIQSWLEDGGSGLSNSLGLVLLASSLPLQQLIARTPTSIEGNHDYSIYRNQFWANLNVVIASRRIQITVFSFSQRPWR
jgi:hypothetical protein